MLKAIFILLLPLLAFSKIQVVTYFPMESNLINKIALDEIICKDIRGRYTETYNELPQSELIKLANSKIFFHFGLDIEKKYAEILLKQNPSLIIVDISSNVTKMNNNPYIWTDPFNMRVVAKNIYDAFIKIDKYKESYYKQNYGKFLDEIDDTFLKIKQKLHTIDIQNIFVFDSYWDYYAKRFGINIYTREKRYLNINEMTPVNEFIKEKNIKKLLFTQDSNYDYIRTLNSSMKVEAVEDNIFGDIWQLNLLNLTQNIIK
jgi:zinc transport system substrate-binding protein